MEQQQHLQMLAAALLGQAPQNVSTLAPTGRMPIPAHQPNVYPVPPNNTGPGDDALIQNRGLPPDRNTYGDAATQWYRTTRQDIPEWT